MLILLGFSKAGRLMPIFAPGLRPVERLHKYRSDIAASAAATQAEADIDHLLASMRRYCFWRHASRNSSEELNAYQ